MSIQSTLGIPLGEGTAGARLWSSRDMPNRTLQITRTPSRTTLSQRDSVVSWPSWSPRIAIVGERWFEGVVTPSFSPQK
jgi:hypothetical protein